MLVELGIKRKARTNFEKDFRGNLNGIVGCLKVRK